MKVWLQSGVKVSTDPRWVPYREYITRRIESTKRADTQIDFYGTQYEHPLMDHSAYIRYLNESQFLENAIKAEKTGYDCFAMSFSLDLGYFSLRNAVSIPVSFLGENTLHVASMLSNKFTLLHWSKDLYMLFNKMVRDYGFESKVIDCDYFEITENKLIEQIARPGAIVDIVKKIAKPAIRQGADLLVPDDNILLAALYQAGLNEIDGVPILDTVAVMVKATEFLVDLHKVGVSRGKTGLYSRLSKGELTDVRNAFGLK